MNWKSWIIVASLLGASGVTLGAYHAHGLEKWLSDRELEPARVTERMDQCETAVRYQMTHALVLLAVGLLAQRFGPRSYRITGFLILAGTVLFSGGLYLMVFADNSIHWSIVPLGGLCLICGWLALGIETMRSSRQAVDSH